MNKNFSISDFSVPLRLQRDNFTDNQWGGDWIPRWKGLPVPAQPVGEAWEFSAHANRPSLVDIGGAHVPLNEVMKSAPVYLFGDALARRLNGAAPFLLKFIDSRDDLSVQVHPDDDYARAHERDNGKAESWVILGVGTGPGDGFLYVGFDSRRADGFATNDDFREAFLSAIDQANGEGPSEDPRVREKAERLVLPFLNRIPVRPGEVYDLPPGTIHAVGRGVRLFEIQQDSDVTYRVWDWNRPDSKKLKEGKREFRALHLAHAKHVIDFAAKPPEAYRREPVLVPVAGEGKRSRSILLEDSGRRFAADRLEIFEGGSARLPGNFCVITVVSGQAVIETGAESRSWGELSEGHSALVPAAAALAGVVVRGPALLIRSYVPG